MRTRLVVPALLASTLALVGLTAPAQAERAADRGADCTIVGTRHADVLVGTKHADVICGLGGNDVIRGRGGDDVIRGGKGDDLIIPGAGADLVSCGPGHDRVRSDGNDTLAADCEGGSVLGTASPAPSAPPAPPVDGAPVAVADTATITEDDDATPIDVLANDTNPDGGPIAIDSITQPAHGTAAKTADGVSYEPNANYCGTDSFTYTLAPGGSTATVTVDVTCVDDDPVAVDDEVTVLEDADAVPLDVLANDTDIDGGDLTIGAAGSPVHGAVTRYSTSLAYTPEADYCGSDSFTYELAPGGSTATVHVTVQCVEDSPVAAAQTSTIDEDTSIVLQLFGGDSDGDDLTFDITNPSHGSVGSVSDPRCYGTFCGVSVTYTPEPNFHGEDAFTYTVSDGDETSDAAEVSITVTSVNDVPVATAQDVTTAEDTAVGVTLAGTDADGDDLHYDVATQPQHGTLSSDLVYTPDPDYNGRDSFTFTAGDEDATSDAATVSITVTPVNDAPVVDDGAVRTAQGDAVAIDLADDASDVETSDANLTYAVGTPLHGTISGDAPNLTYTPFDGFSGTDSFTFHVTDRGDPDDCGGTLPDCDGAASSDDKTITVTVDKAGCFTDTTEADFRTGTVDGCTRGASPGDVLLNKDVVDQANTTGGTVGVYVRPNQSVSQTFTAARTGSLSQLYVGMYCMSCVGSPSDVLVSIRSTSNGVPVGGDLATGRITGFTSATGQYYLVRLATPLPIVSRSSYAIVVRVASGFTSGSYAVYASGTTVNGADVYSGGVLAIAQNSDTSWTVLTGTNGASYDALFQTTVDGYLPSGTLTSGVKDAAPSAGSTPTWKQLVVDADVPDGTGISFQVAASRSASGPFTFVGPDGTANTSFKNGDELNMFDGKRYLQYRATLTSSDPTKTPSLHSVTICYLDSSAPVQ